MNPLKIILIVMAGAIVLPWDVSLIPGPVPRLNLQTENTQPLDEPGYTRESIMFPSIEPGIQLEAWVYKPKQPVASPPPVVVMGHGLGAQKDMGLHNYASRFANAGLAVFVFDYRSFGGSDGEPRNWISPRRHLQDWRAALGHVQGPLAAGGAVDGGAVAVWGTSFGGGHALVMAGEQKDGVKAVVAQVPFLDGKVTLQRNYETRGLLTLLRGATAGIHDLVRTTLGHPGAYMPIAGRPGSNALMQLDDYELESYFSKHPKVYQGGWRNQARAVFALEASSYRPIASVANITAPVLYVTATKDALCPQDVIARAVQATRNAVQLVMDCTHFDVYRGAELEEVAAEEERFLLQHLAPSGGGGGARGGGGGDAGGGGGAAGGAAEGHEEL
ncbi:MAG: alpha/beta-hydrolase [Monoraphidium minutum]|nr:MAG: alpha/beta-hydrolase [Monoraphidium minutum]